MNSRIEDVPKEEYDFLCDMAHSSFYHKREFKLNKGKWAFHCFHCEQKIQSHSGQYTHYYVWNFMEFGEVERNYGHDLLCSPYCVNQVLAKIGVDVVEYNKEIDEIMKEWDALENEREAREKARDNEYFEEYSFGIIERKKPKKQTNKK